MLFVYDKSTVQGKVKWKIKNPDILSGKKKITYISPGGYTFRTNNNELIGFDFCDSSSILNLKEGIITSELFSIEHEYITEQLEQDGYNHLIKEDGDYRLDLFKDFKEFTEVYCFVDVDEEEVDEDLECVYFELYDPISEEVLMLVGECDV